MADKVKPRAQGFGRKAALWFVILFGAVSLFADMTYEGARSITGPYLKLLGAGAATVGFVAGFGELVGYAFRLVTGYLADKTKRYWLLTITGYAINLLAVPLLALTGRWWLAAALLVMERFGKAVRNPARDAMLSYARTQIGAGWTYGLHEALDQIGAVLGPVLVAGVLYLRRNDYRLAFGVLLLPALVALIIVITARFLYPRPADLEVKRWEVKRKGLTREYWLYMAAVGLIGLGFADYPLLAYHFSTQKVFPETTIPVLYALAMGADAVAALVFGRLYDRLGVKVLVPATLLAASFAPLVFLGGNMAALAGVIAWGLGMGWQESVMRAVVADMTPKDKRASAFGIFNAGYGIFWFIGSWLLGTLYDLAVKRQGPPFPLVVFSVIAQLAALPFYIHLARRKTTLPPSCHPTG